MTKLFLLATAAIAAAASPALARDGKPSETATTEVSQPASDATRTKVREQRYCIKEMVTGSYIPFRTCKTRAEWLQEGFDPLAK